MNKLTLTSVSLTLYLLLLVSQASMAQTTGLIFEPATGGGAAILDPNGDGYTSKTTVGFIGNDETDSELPLVPIVFPNDEPDSDLGPGPDCGFTDFVQQAVGVQDAAQNYLNPTTKEWIFRLRMGNSSPNSKSYSILIDTDQKFGSIGTNADPDYTATNPGFELELVLATNFGVYVYDVNSTPTLKISYSGHTNYQKSIAASLECGTPDYFYDFFVDFDDITALFPTLTPAPQ